MPTVSWTAEAFVRNAMVSAEAFGLRDLTVAVIPKPATNRVADLIRHMVDQSFSQVPDGLTKPVEITAQAASPSQVLPFEGDDQLNALEKMNQQFLDNGWSDGFPLMPATEQAVNRMVGETRLSRDKVVAILEPGFGIATVEKIAVNAVMAGCRPEHMPVLITAVQCISDPRIFLRNQVMSTGGQAPLILVNGPVTKRLRINSKTCALGPGSMSYANTAIGRALRLVMMNIGLTYPGATDMATVGSPLKYGMCVAENEAENPWEPYHVENGYDKNTSTVTVMFVYKWSPLVNDTSPNPELLLDAFSTAMTQASAHAALWLIGRRSDPRYNVDQKEERLIFFCPEQARLFADHGWDKSSLRQYLFDRSRMPFKTLMLGKHREAMMTAHPELSDLWDHPDTLLPVVETPDCIQIAVVGGGGPVGAYFEGAGGAVTKPIEETL